MRRRIFLHSNAFLLIITNHPARSDAKTLMVGTEYLYTRGDSGSLENSLNQFTGETYEFVEMI
jgi:hypothetical protein